MRQQLCILHENIISMTAILSYKHRPRAGVFWLYGCQMIIESSLISNKLTLDGEGEEMQMPNALFFIFFIYILYKK